MGMDRSARVCMLDRDTVQVTMSGVAQVATKAEIVAMLSDTKDILSTFRQVKPIGSDRELCPIPMVTQWASDMIGRETDCREYRISRPRLRSDVTAFRVIRAERTKCQREGHKKRTDGK